MGGKKHHQSKRKHRSRDRGGDRSSRSGTSISRSHHASQTSIPSISFTIPDHPSGVPPPLPSPLPPAHDQIFNFPPPPPNNAPPLRPPRPVIIRQHGLYTYHNGTPQHQPRGHVQSSSGNFNERPVALPPRTKENETRSAVGEYKHDTEKGIATVVNREGGVEGEEFRAPKPANPRRRRLTCILMLTLTLVFFVGAPIVIGVGISAAKKKHNSGDSNTRNNLAVDGNGVPTIPSEDNGLSYGDWFCGGCRCVKDQDALTKCLEKLNTSR